LVYIRNFVLFAIGMAICSVWMRANDLTEEVRRIRLLEDEGHLPQAIQATSILIDTLERSGARASLIAEALDRRASLEQDLGDFAEGERDYSKAITLWEAATVWRPLSLATELNNLASLYSSTGQFTKAEGLRRRSLALRLQFSDSDGPETALSLSNLAIDLFRQDRYLEAVSLCHQALDIWAKADSQRNRSDLALNTLAVIELKELHFQNGLSLALAALRRYETCPRPTKVQRVAYEHTIALAREANGQFAKAQQTFETARNLLQGTEHPPALEEYSLFRDYAHLLCILKRKKQSKQLLREANAAISHLHGLDTQRYTVDLNALLSAPSKK